MQIYVFFVFSASSESKIC